MKKPAPPAPAGNHQGERMIAIPLGLKPQLKAVLESSAATNYRNVQEQIRVYIVEGLKREGFIK